jgi:hypothetical protein
VTRHQAVGVAAAAVLALSTLAACGSFTPVEPGAVTSPGSPSFGDSASTVAGQGATRPVVLAAVLGELSRLRVAGRGPMTGYSRAQFGPAWEDTDRNGCDTRNDILRRDLEDLRLKPGTHGCVLLGGTLHDPYSGRSILFQRGQGTSELVQIDHVVALGDAWQSGAAHWPSAKRLAFANDPLDLLAVDGALNQQKGDANAASWLPPDTSFRCAYVARQVSVKAAYQLSVTAAEKAAMQRVLAGCPAQSAP